MMTTLGDGVRPGRAGRWLAPLEGSSPISLTVARDFTEPSKAVTVLSASATSSKEGRWYPDFYCCLHFSDSRPWPS